MATAALNAWKTEAVVLLYTVAFILITAGSAGKQSIAWLLMKLYEIFIQKTALKI